MNKICIATALLGKTPDCTGSKLGQGLTRLMGKAAIYAKVCKNGKRQSGQDDLERKNPFSLSP